MKNILVMAAGAVGGYFGGLLSNKNNVVFIARGEHLQVAKSKGLCVKSKTSGEFSATGVFASEVPRNYNADLILFCVKEYHNKQAAEVIAPAVGDGTAIMTLQNGIGSADFLAKIFTTAQIITGAAYVEATKIGPGMIEEHGGDCLIKFGPYLTSSELYFEMDEISNLLFKSGIENEARENINDAIWEKLIFISALSGMTCITRSEFSDVISNPKAKHMTWRLLNESYEVAIASGAELPKSTPSLIMKDFIEGKDELVSSMHSDLKNGNPLEIRAINGAISKTARELKINSPLNDMICNSLDIYDHKARTTNGDI
jgi:2-dehydropantoate 2-reductase